jgi:DNA-binding transcriptional ArsR family regulator
VDVYVAVNDPVRRSLLEQLAGSGPARVVDLAAGRGISRPAVSRHLRVLGEAGLVTATDHGRERHYELVPEPLHEVVSWVAALTRTARPPVAEHHLDALDLEVRRTVRDRGDRDRGDRNRADRTGAPHTGAGPGTTPRKTAGESA